MGFIKNLKDKANQKALGAISKYTKDDEEVIHFLDGEITPPNWWTWVPVLKTVYTFKRRHNYICLTNYGLRILEYNGMKPTSIKSNKFIPHDKFLSFQYNNDQLKCFCRGRENILHFKNAHPEKIKELVFSK